MKEAEKKPAVALSGIPSVTELLKKPEISSAAGKTSHRFVVDTLREVLDKFRKEMLAGKRSATFNFAEFLPVFEAALDERFATSYPRAINATGIILHTNLGRAVLPGSALKALFEHQQGYSVLQVSRETGERNRRDENIERLLCALTGAEAATVVNNNAAATLLILSSIGKGKEVICSRGQMIEIGGEFRIPDVMAQSGAILREVGATNKTHAKDYENAINENTAALLRVHTSNYKIIGFSEEVPLEEIAAVGRKHKIPVLDDLGSGALVHLRRYGFPEDEPLIADSIAAGADVACFSTDKLIGGPQGGAIVGRKDLIQKIRKNPLARAMRVDKTCLLLLEETLKLFFDPDKLPEKHPVYAMISTPMAELHTKAGKIARAVKKAGVPFDAKVEEDFSQLGSGSLPGQDVPTWVLSLSSESGKELEDAAYKLRMYGPPIFSRIGKGKLMFDMRTLLPGEDAELTNALVALFGKKPV
jgi:L-seryl-tRNA(Ser) seleniumtransferase